MSLSVTAVVNYYLLWLHLDFVAFSMSPCLCSKWHVTMEEVKPCPSSELVNSFSVHMEPPWLLNCPMTISAQASQHIHSMLLCGSLESVTEEKG